MERRLAMYRLRKAAARATMAAVVFLCVAFSASAQTGLVVSPEKVMFTAMDHATQDNGVPVITHYVIELWNPGDDTTLGVPRQQSQDIPKATAIPTPGVADEYTIRFVDVPSLTIPKGPTYVATLLTKGSGGSARSAASNPFNFPIPVRAPRPATGLRVVGK